MAEGVAFWDLTSRTMGSSSFTPAGKIIHGLDPFIFPVTGNVEYHLPTRGSIVDSSLGELEV